MYQHTSQESRHLAWKQKIECNTHFCTWHPANHLLNSPENVIWRLRPWSHRQAKERIFCLPFVPIYWVSVYLHCSLTPSDQNWTFLLHQIITPHQHMRKHTCAHYKGKGANMRPFFRVFANCRKFHSKKEKQKVVAYHFPLSKPLVWLTSSIPVLPCNNQHKIQEKCNNSNQFESNPSDSPPLNEKPSPMDSSASIK
jgi:hypothetical protein